MSRVNGHKTQNCVKPRFTTTKTIPFFCKQDVPQQQRSPTMRIRFAALLVPLTLAAALEQQSLLRNGMRGRPSKAGGSKAGKSTNGMRIGRFPRPGPNKPPANKSPTQDRCPTGKKPNKDLDDMGYRFNKFRMLDGTELVLDWNDFPLSKNMANTLQHKSDGYSVITNDDFEVKNACLDKYIQALGGYPTMPSKDPNATYWTDLEIVVRAQMDRQKGKLPPPRVLTLPKLWENFTVSDVGEAVNGEYPRTHQNNMIKSFLTEGGTAGIELDYNILPFRSKKDFIGLTIRLAALNTWSLGAVAPANFAVKWSIGRCRPEVSNSIACASIHGHVLFIHTVRYQEVVWMIATDVITKRDGANPTVVDLIKSMNLTNATSFTQYPQGSPQHPAWPGMHGAGSTASLWLAVVANLTPEQYCQVLRTDYAVAYGRLVAGVHYHSDNMAGLNMGQTVIAEKLAVHLHRMYGSNKKAVREKIRKLQFDWHTFDPEACTVVYKY